MSSSNEIAANGAWLVNDSARLAEIHCFDASLAQALAGFLKGKSVVDIGCGPGHYTWHFLQNGIVCRGYDGNPYTMAITRGLCDVADVSQPCDFGYVFDWVVSLEVGEHIPSDFQDAYIENLVRHCREGMVLSWAVEGQGGTGHVNCRHNDWVRAKLHSQGFVSDLAQELALREASTLDWFRYTVMVFQKVTSTK
jgi:cyclopropane fatty-acyl-phospholipid synthase-like methyltransferase